jgi:ferredoxin--NADP+ reductase
VTGWIKRGPSGIIGTNKKCAAETVSRLLEDLASGALRRQPDPPCGEVAAWVSKHQPDFVTERGWQAIDEAERAAGSDSGRPRVKLCTSDELLDVALDR